MGYATPKPPPEEKSSEDSEAMFSLVSDVDDCPLDLVDDLEEIMNELEFVSESPSGANS